MPDALSRRRLLQKALLGSAGTGLLSRVAAARQEVSASPPATAQPPGTCVLFPQAVEGPYYFDPNQVRSDITEGSPGLPMRLVLKVIEHGTCAPITSARVDVWHTDALGVYSGYPGQGDNRTVTSVGRTYLRGTQISDPDGQVVFQTIYPGWYPGRTPHIHIKVFLNKETLVTSQIYFPDALSARIYRDHEPYIERPSPDTTNGNDYFFQLAMRDGGGVVLEVEDAADALTASLTLSVDRSAGTNERASIWDWFKR